MTLTITLTIVLMCVLAEAFFSGSEIAVVSINRSHLRYLVEKGSKKASVLEKVLKEPEWLLGTTLLGTNFSTITLNAVVTFYVIQNFGPKYEFFTILFTAPLVLMFGEVLPKAIFQRFANQIALEIIYPLRFFSLITLPVVAFFAWIARLFTFATGIKNTKKTPFITREELELMFKASEQEKGLAKDIERKMIDRVFSFSELTARDIMIPLVKMISISNSSSLRQTIDLISQYGHSRIPIYSGRIDNIVGWITHYDIIRSENLDTPVKEKLREAFYAPAGVSLEKLLLQLQRRGESIAILVDEFGGVIGMVAMEDILEQVMGEIEDEFDATEYLIRKAGSDQLVLSARITIKQLNEILPKDLPEGDYETLNGFLSVLVHRIPRQDEKIEFLGMEFMVSKASKRGAEEVVVNLTNP